MKSDHYCESPPEQADKWFWRCVLVSDPWTLIPAPFAIDFHPRSPATRIIVSSPHGLHTELKSPDYSSKKKKYSLQNAIDKIKECSFLVHIRKVSDSHCHVISLQESVQIKNGLPLSDLGCCKVVTGHPWVQMLLRDLADDELFSTLQPISPQTKNR